MDYLTMYFSKLREFTLIQILLLCVNVQIVFSRGFQIYSGEHLDNVIMKSDNCGVTDRNAVLLVYDNTCSSVIEQYHINPNALPLTKYVTFLTHDYVTSQTNTWYGYNGDDIKERYDITTCWAVLFIPEGSRRDSEPRRWTPQLGQPFSDWVWDQVRVMVTIRNKLDTAIVINVIRGYGNEGGPPEIHSVFSDPGTEQTLMAPLSYIVTAESRDPTEGGNYHGTWLLSRLINDILIQGNSLDNSAKETQIQHIATIEQEDDNNQQQLISTHGQRHILNLKQPLLVRNFTDVGYLKLAIPPKWYKILHDFYKENLHNRAREAWTRVDSVINYHEIPTTIVNLSEDVRNKVAKGLQTMMEVWCETKLETTAFYGIREYYTGNVLHHHVDRISTHIISAILQIDQDLGDGDDDWLLEFIDFNGERKEIALAPGEMLMYESAKAHTWQTESIQGESLCQCISPLQTSEQLGGILA